MKKRWYENNITVIACLLLCFPFGIVMMWRYAEWKKWIKISITAIIASGISIFTLSASPDAHSITVNPSVVYLEPDMIKLIDVKIYPENTNPKNIKYISTDKSVARAKDGQIRGISPGYAEIYVEDIKSGAKSDIIKVTVVKSIVAELSSAKADTVSEISAKQTKTYSTNKTHDQATKTSVPQKEGVVYTGKTGTKYHRYNCSTLKDTKNEMTLEEAVAAGKTPCKKCNP